MTAFIDRLDHPGIRAFYAFWLAKRGRRKVPSRTDFDPVELKPYLPHLFMIDVVGMPARFRYRLCGIAVAAIYGEFTGAWVDEFLPANFREVALARLADAAENLHVHYLVQRLTWQDRPYVRYRRLLMPLSDDQVRANILLGVVYADAEADTSVHARAPLDAVNIIEDLSARWNAADASP